MHGTSSKVSYFDGCLTFSSRGEPHDVFSNLFDAAELSEKIKAKDVDKLIIYGEAYGGKQQAMSSVYGKELKFIAFDVRIGGLWLSVTDACAFCNSLGLEFVFFWDATTDMKSLNEIQGMPSKQAERNGMGSDKKSEGIVIRPKIALRKNNGERICAKYKSEEFRETKTRRPISSEKLIILEKADEIASEWVTENRLNNILSKIQKNPGMKDIPIICKLMIADVEEESIWEIIKSPEARKAIGKRTVILFKKKIMKIE